MGETNVLFSIGPLEVTGAVVTMWVIIAVLALLSWLATRRLRDGARPTAKRRRNGRRKAAGLLRRHPRRRPMPGATSR